MGDARKLNSTHILYLPRDVLLEVLSLVPASDLVLNASGVCREWRNMSEDAGAWRGRRLRVSPRSHRPLSRAERTVLRRAPHLRALAVSLRRAADLPAPLSRLLPACRRLRALQLAVPALAVAMVADVRQHWPQLEELTVDASRIDGVAVEEVACMRGLQRLQMTTFQSDIWDHLPQLSACDALRSLKVDAPCREGAVYGPANLVTSVSGRLKELSFGILTPATDQLFTAIGSCERLESLCVEDCLGLTDAGLLELCGLRLVSLALHNTRHLTCAGLQRFLHRMDLSLLRFLDLTACSALTDDILRLLVRRCPYPPVIVTKDCPRVSQHCLNAIWGNVNERHGSSHNSVDDLITPFECSVLAHSCQIALPDAPLGMA